MEGRAGLLQTRRRVETAMPEMPTAEHFTGFEDGLKDDKDKEWLTAWMHTLAECVRCLKCRCRKQAGASSFIPLTSVRPNEEHAYAQRFKRTNWGVSCMDLALLLYRHRYVEDFGVFCRRRHG